LNIAAMPIRKLKPTISAHIGPHGLAFLELWASLT